MNNCQFKHIVHINSIIDHLEKSENNKLFEYMTPNQKAVIHVLLGFMCNLNNMKVYYDNELKKYGYNFVCIHFDDMGGIYIEGSDVYDILCDSSDENNYDYQMIYDDIEKITEFVSYYNKLRKQPVW